MAKYYFNVLYGWYMCCGIGHFDAFHFQAAGMYIKYFQKEIPMLN
jgi:hypothetical protein